MIAWYTWHLPHFSLAFLSQGVLHSVVLLLVMPCLWITDPAAIIALVSLCIFVDLAGRFPPALLILATGYLTDRKRKRRDPESPDKCACKEQRSPYFSDRHVPAMNIEHHVERTLSFVVRKLVTPTDSNIAESQARSSCWERLSYPCQFTLFKTAH